MHTPRSSGGFQLGVRARKYPRAKIEGFVGDIADEKMAYTGTVIDVSAGGFKLADIPDSFMAKKHVYKTILSKTDKRYKILAKPCWKKHDIESRSVEIGFKIINVSWEWLAFTMDTIDQHSNENTSFFHS